MQELNKIPVQLFFTQQLLLHVYYLYLIITRQDYRAFDKKRRSTNKIKKTVTHFCAFVIYIILIFQFHYLMTYHNNFCILELS